MTTSSVAEAKAAKASSSSSSVVFVRRRNDFTPVIFWASLTRVRGCQNGGEKTLFFFFGFPVDGTKLRAYCLPMQITISAENLFAALLSPPQVKAPKAVAPVAHDNPHFPALRADPMALSGASRKSKFLGTNTINKPKN